MQMKLTLIAAALLPGPLAMATDELTAATPLVYANQYHDGINLQDYWQSEKLDGIRALWDGQQLVTRTGHPIHAPKWFTEPLPAYPLEGELWAGRGNFPLVQQTVLDHTPSDSAWQHITFMLFDIPQDAGDYSKRYATLVQFVQSAALRHVKYVEHTAIESEPTLFDYLDRLVEQNGEGVMLRKISAPYQAGRSDDLIKLKKHQDSEATVIGYKTGQGKYQGSMGSLLVRTAEGIEFAVGSGFSDALRRQPPEIGSVITYRYNGLTAEGKPRFARFVRIQPRY